MIGIIGAMDEEVDSLVGKMDILEIDERAGMRFCRGRLLGRTVCVVRSGIGKVNAAVCAEILCDKGADVIINTGIAGGMQSFIRIGDVVISSDAVQHDMDAVGFGYPLGQIPRMEVFSFTADQRLISAAKEACEATGRRCHVGRVVSGDQFISDKTRKEFIRDNFQAYCTEMEGAAIAQVAYLNNVPFVILRVISDNADDVAIDDDLTYESNEINNSADLVADLLERL